MRWELVLPSMPGEEGDAPAPHLAHSHRGRRVSVGRVDLDLAHTLEERVKPRSPEDADLGGGQAVFSLLASFFSPFSLLSPFFSPFSPSAEGFDEAGAGLRESVA